MTNLSAHLLGRFLEAVSVPALLAAAAVSIVSGRQAW
jgi:hypothetical protein